MKLSKHLCLECSTRAMFLSSSFTVSIMATQKYFRSTRSEVVNKMTGSKVMFRGIKSSSGNQTLLLI